jgi:hypothetical protein
LPLFCHAVLTRPATATRTVTPPIRSYHAGNFGHELSQDHGHKARRGANEPDQ